LLIMYLKYVVNYLPCSLYISDMWRTSLPCLLCNKNILLIISPVYYIFQICWWLLSLAYYVLEICGWLSPLFIIYFRYMDDFSLLLIMYLKYVVDYLPCLLLISDMLRILRPCILCTWICGRLLSLAYYVLEICC
jgi:hypothetical protein